MDRFAIIGDEWLIGQEVYPYTAVVIKQPTTFYSIEKRYFESLRTLIGNSGLQAWRELIQVGRCYQTRINYRGNQEKDKIVNLLKMTQQSISASPASFARIRVKKSGFTCAAEAKHFKALDRDMQKFMVSSTLRQSESIQIVDKLINTKTEMKSVRTAEIDLIKHIQKKEDLAMAIAHENKELEEQSNM